ncbi:MULTISPECIES: PEP-CTERM sorting domain-containing protein [unclassified Lentimonas]|uniref:PEP-CTERM sorting domain-containing protein n=1 Tax=unclassified Lentimonas TaxID=2630993 RepID=UPI00132203D6|nr:MULTISPECIES: PEP-CTERM sorting domain-containing protein [unclassified Lentimonas]CAA6691225.1 Unannotated [Lentimonas sp. CC19]CAA6694812.1 Unannotated [Lentimonas sp. CC10]CAA7071603.1 Unannotated [Lentimonas sp. CC11]
MTKLTPYILGASLCFAGALSAQTTVTIFETDFSDAAATSLTDVVRSVSGGGFSDSGFDAPNGGTDGAGNYDIDLDASGDTSSFSNLSQTVNLGTGTAGTGVAAGTILTQTLAISGISWTETANNLRFGIGLYDAANSAQLNLRTSNTGTRLRVEGTGFGQSGVDVDTGNAYVGGTSLSTLEMRWVIDVAANTYTASYRETIGSGTWITSAAATDQVFGYHATDFNELNRVRIISSGGWADSSVSLDSFKVELTTVPEPSAYALIAGAFGLAFVMVRRRRA